MNRSRKGRGETAVGERVGSPPTAGEAQRPRVGHPLAGSRDARAGSIAPRRSSGDNGGPRNQGGEAPSAASFLRSPGPRPQETRAPPPAGDQRHGCIGPAQSPRPGTFAAVCGGCSGLPVEVRSAEAPVVAKAVFHQQDADAGSNLLQSDAWRPWQAGFSLEADAFVCDNGADIEVQRGISQTVVLNQDRPEPIVATAWSKSVGVSGAADRGYALYLDLIYADGTPLWGQTASFRPGTHDWERRQVLILPEKPVKQVSYHLLLRGHGGKAFFRDPRLVVLADSPRCLSV